MKTSFKNQISKILTVVFVLSCTSCQLPSPQVNRALSQMANYEVRITDLPSGWTFNSEHWSQDYGGQSHLVVYGIDNDQIIHLAHTISIYEGQEQAESAYPKWEVENFKGSWQKWPGADFVPSHPNDAYKFECLQVLSDKSLISCRYLQRHKRLISFVLVNLRDNVMTFAQLNDVLKAVDDRLNKIELK